MVDILLYVHLSNTNNEISVYNFIPSMVRNNRNVYMYLQLMKGRVRQFLYYIDVIVLYNRSQ